MLPHETITRSPTNSLKPKRTGNYSAPDRPLSTNDGRGLLRRAKRMATPRSEAGRRLVGRKIGLTSKVMQAATGITEPDYGAIFEDMVYENGSVIEFDRFFNVRIEVELAFVLAGPAGAEHERVT